MSDIFNEIAEAQELRRSENFRDGHYIVKITDAVVKKNRHSLKIAIIEGIIMDSTNTQLPRGRSVSWVCKLQGTDMGMRDLKTQFRNIVRCSAEEVTGDLLRTSFNPDPNTGVSPLNGTVCYVYAYTKTLASGNPWTMVEFRGMKDGDVIPDFEEIRTQQNRELQASLRFANGAHDADTTDGDNAEFDSEGVMF